MVAVYFSHSYRDADLDANEYFMNLMRAQGIMPSVDIPSNRLNAAKLERQYSFTSGLICVLPNRESGPSAYILAEIWMAIRSSKPALVFAEDTIPSDFLPVGAILHRYSRKSYWRNTPSHMKIIDYFQGYTGRTALPNVREIGQRRTIFLLGFEDSESRMRDSIYALIENRQYDVVNAQHPSDKTGKSLDYYGNIRSADLVLANVDGLSAWETYLLGFARAAIVPTISVSNSETGQFIKGVPAELGVRLLKNSAKDLVETLNTEIDIFEDEAIDMDEAGEISSYIDFLKSASSSSGRYEPAARTQFIQNFRDMYSVGRAGAAGSGASNVKKGLLN